MTGSDISQPDIVQILAEAGALVRRVREFADEYGEMVLYGVTLPPRAAEELSAMIRCSRGLGEVLARLGDKDAISSAGAKQSRIK